LTKTPRTKGITKKTHWQQCLKQNQHPHGPL